MGGVTGLEAFAQVRTQDEVGKQIESKDSAKVEIQTAADTTSCRSPSQSFLPCSSSPSKESKCLRTSFTDADRACFTWYPWLSLHGLYCYPICLSRLWIQGGWRILYRQIWDRSIVYFRLPRCIFSSSIVLEYSNLLKNFSLE